eukprot:TRINITY_DN14533_c0_g1_i1.p1 TRINITY_DN14533_c0_g1~~TRINITY_DN14533_c0_g1_i1.p1  ORF type:complete len:217 (+),score=66.94 TRINITY_DN14533_c0_g1_i1:73-651(+)
MKAVQVLALFGVLLFVVVAHSKNVIPKQYPLFLQCDPQWGADVIVSETVCQVGCLMSSISMALNGQGLTIPEGGQNNSTANPGTLNSWLLQNHGYTQGNDLREKVVQLIDPKRIHYVGAFIPQTALVTKQIVSWLNDRSYGVIANVLNGSHFVLVTGYESENEEKFLVNDPYFNTTSYMYHDIVGWRVYNFQ